MSDATTPAAARPVRLAAALVAAGLLAGVPALAPSLAPAAAAQNPAPADDALTQAVEDYYHFASIAQYEAAKNYAQNILDQNPDPAALLDALNAVHDLRGGERADLDRKLLRWQGVDQISEETEQIVAIVNEGRRGRATDPAFIREQIERLNLGGFVYQNAVNNLRASGGFAVPTMLLYLADPARAPLHGDINRALRDLGLPVVDPLLAATEAEDKTLLAQVLLALGDLGYPAAIPYVLEAQAEDQGQQVQQAASRALDRLGYDGQSDAATEYRRLAEQFWRNESPIRPDARFEGANVWKWNGQTVEATTVPAQVFDEVMAMRTAGKSLALGQQQDRSPRQGVQDEAMALWLASNYRREGELEPGELDPTAPANAADYYGTQAGVDFLQQVLDRAMSERSLPPENRYDSADVALRAIRSLQEVIGQETLAEGDTPLTRAMNYPDRRVRIEAAMALAQALPTRPVTGSEQVVPLLADALSQSGRPVVLLVMDSRDQINTVGEALEEGGYRVESATNPTEAVDQALALPGVDVLLIDSNLGDAAVRNMLSLARGTPKLDGAAKLIATQTSQSDYERDKTTDPTLATTVGTDPATLVPAVGEAREQVGGLPLDTGEAGTLAGRAGELLREIGLGSSIFTLGSAQSQLLSSLDDERVDIQVLAAEIVSLLDGAEPQRALLQKAINPDTEEPVKIAALRGLAASAKRVGNQLGGGEVEQLLQIARESEELPVRDAAAEAVGALSLPVDQVRSIIVDDTATGSGSAE